MSRQTKRQKHQLELAFDGEAKGEALSTSAGGAEVLSAAPVPESPAALVGPMMERIVARDNLKKALAQVRRNKGAPGVDGMTVDDLAAHLKDHWPEIRAQLLNGTYQPQSVRRVDIPKASGGTRGLGIPSVLDRFLQQAVMQVLQEDWDPTFSPSSYGFRPGRSAHQAVAAAQQFIADGCHTVVDLDLEKFFDRVNHDILMGLVAKRVQDRSLLRLIRRYLTAGVLVGGMVDPTDEGVPQGGPLSPLLSNLMLDVLDKELERRGHRFARYADDCNIYVRSPRAGERVMASVTRFLERRLKLRVNTAKSAVASPTERKFPRLQLFKPRPCIAPQALARFKQQVRELTSRTSGRSLAQVIPRLSRYLIGWRGYFGFCETRTELRSLDRWIRRRLRAIVWKQWKYGTTRFAELRRRSIRKELAAKAAGSPHGVWRLSQSPALSMAFPNAFFRDHGLASVYVRPVE
ncbi:group II intron reverse transcriptase/maturase [Mesorhizobium sp. M0808]|uniref:group II intron reverse transcriptase/maturase n=1 Tax=Mesorhizobium sp. M0808 TaxID=2957002 RepID=UPI0033360DCA